VRRLLSIASFALVVTACGPATSTSRASATTEPLLADRTAETVAGRTDPPSECRPDSFQYPPVDLDAVEYLVPFGMMIDSHVTPIDHQYFQNFKEPDRRINVYSPADGRVVAIQHFQQLLTDGPRVAADDYLLTIQHTCKVSSTFIHVGHLEPRIEAVAPPSGQYSRVDIAVKAGELIGWFTKNVDYNLVDLDFETDGIVDPSSYEREPWKTHVPDTFDYFDSSISERMRSLSLRTAEPRGGVFTWDIDGRLVGNWFEEGTNGYGGVNQDRYWAGHLAFAYDHIDPSMLVISIGTWNGRAGQFAVTGNSPDPATVDVGTGPVVFELTYWDYWVGDQRWDRVSFAQGIRALPAEKYDGVIGSVLVELIDGRTLRFEVFPGVEGSDVTGFTEAARQFTR